MACRGVHFALSADQEKSLLDCGGDDEAVLEIIQEQIEDEWDEEWLYESDKSWDAIHRCLTDGKLAASRGKRPLSFVILGGEHLYSRGGYYVCLIKRQEVPEVADALSRFTRQDFDRAYSLLTKSDYSGPINDDDREYTWENVEGLNEFFRKAAEADRAVVFTVDQ
jgi:hypothetical protein